MRNKEETTKSRSARFKIIRLINFICAMMLFVAYLAPRISPASFWPIAFFGLAYPYLVIVNLLFLIYWLIGFRKPFMISLMAILCGWNFIPGFLQVNLGSDQVEENEGIKVMTFNVRLFNLYEWSDNKRIKDSIFDYLSKESPDIVCFQEFFYSDINYFPTLSALPSVLKTGHNHVVDTRYVPADKQHFGLATFSKHPILNKGQINFNSKSNGCSFADIKINEDTIRVYNVHLASIHFVKADYENLDDPSIEASKSTIGKIKSAFIRRADQAEQIAEHVKSSPFPVILCGDFNDTPASYSYQTLKEGLTDAFRESGSGFGNTHKGFLNNAFAKHFSFRIDYLLHDPAIKSGSFARDKVDLSDHYPLKCNISLSEKEE